LAKTDSYLTNYILPINTLTNGIECKLYITIYDASNNSATSYAVIFKTSTRPVAGFESEVVTAQTNLFTCDYGQDENVPMASWIVYIYDLNDNLLGTSGIQATTPIQYRFSGLQSGNTYQIRWEVSSADGLIGVTQVNFDVVYAQPDLKVQLTATNVDNAGIQLSGNIAQIIGITENTTYIDNEEIDTRNGRVYFNQGFNCVSDFTLKFHFREVPNLNFYNKENIKIIECATAPSDTTALWIENSAQATEKVLGLVKSNTAPVSDCVWIEDTSLTGETAMTLNVGLEQPNSNNIAWIDVEVDLNNYTILIIGGDLVNITLKHYNDKFYLYRNNTIVDELIVAETPYCLIIQQIDGILSLANST
jgi:hypothetical protein